MARVLLIGLAGALGTLCRHFVGVWAGRMLGPGFPYGTLIVNVVGCFLIALVCQGFGAASVIHTAHLVDLGADLPVLIEVVEDQEHLDKLLPILDEMLTSGALVTIEKVRVLRYAAGVPGSKRPTPPKS